MEVFSDSKNVILHLAHLGKTVIHSGNVEVSFNASYSCCRLMDGKGQQFLIQNFAESYNLQLCKADILTSTQHTTGIRLLKNSIIVAAGNMQPAV